LRRVTKSTSADEEIKMVAWIALLLTLVLVWTFRRQLTVMQTQIDLMSKEINNLQNMQSRLFLTVMPAGEPRKVASTAHNPVPVQKTKRHSDAALSD
jgi:hypothetical protein